MNNERFAIPEILFRPSDIGIEQIGLAEAINHVVGLTDTGEWLLVAAVSYSQNSTNGTTVLE